MIAVRKTNEQAGADADADAEGCREERRARWQAMEGHGNARQELPDAGWQQAPWAPRVRMAAAGRVLSDALGEHSQWHEAFSAAYVSSVDRAVGLALAQVLHAIDEDTQGESEGALAGEGLRW